MLTQFERIENAKEVIRKAQRQIKDIKEYQREFKNTASVIYFSNGGNRHHLGLIYRDIIHKHLHEANKEIEMKKKDLEMLIHNTKLQFE